MRTEENLQHHVNYQDQPEIDEHRALLFTELGFDKDWAKFLASSRTSETIRGKDGAPKTYSRPFHWTDAKRLLENGLTHEQVCARAG